MECGYPKDKRFGAIDGTPVASTGKTPARRWLESLTGFLAMELKKYALRSRNHFWQKEKSQILDECCRGKLPKGILSEITTDPETMPEN